MNKWEKTRNENHSQLVNALTTVPGAEASRGRKGNRTMQWNQHIVRALFDHQAGLSLSRPSDRGSSKSGCFNLEPKLSHKRLSQLIWLLHPSAVIPSLRAVVGADKKQVGELFVAADRQADYLPGTGRFIYFFFLDVEFTNFFLTDFGIFSFLFSRFDSLTACLWAWLPN